VGCTGGQHRSVAIACYLWETLRSRFHGSVVLRHRDIV
jgi:RNase adaptor protein for sRNA GlmZ degradation